MKSKRSQKSTHFREEAVSMKALNDPIPPFHLESPEPEPKPRSGPRYYDIDLSDLKPKSTTSEVAHNAQAVPSNVTYKPSRRHNSFPETQVQTPSSAFDQFEDLPLNFELSQSM